LNPLDLEEQHRGLSPHPEDTPAPLFSSGSATPAGVAEQSAENLGAVSDVPAESSPMDEVVASEDAVGSADSVATQDQRQPQANIPLEPVVGDYLKMQFVEHRVVPAILVRDTQPCIHLHLQAPS
jgi:SIT4-associating protein SAP185/190